jgi:hypothetical protein
MGSQNDEFARTISFNPIMNRNTNPGDQKHVARYVSCDPYAVVNHLKTLITVGTAIIKRQ